MHAYTIALFVHLCALLAAVSAAALITFSMRRLRTTRTGGEALQWLGLGKSASHVFPVALLTLVASGAYMVHSSWSWGRPFVDAGLAGVVFLGVVGDRVEGSRARRAAEALAPQPAEPIDERGRALLRDPLWWTAAMANQAVAIGVVFVMVTKPSALGAALALCVAIAAGALVAVPLWRTPAEQAAGSVASTAD